MQGGETGSPEVEDIVFPQADAARSAPPKKDYTCGVGKWLSTGILAAISFVLPPEPQALVSSYTTLVRSALPPPEP